jgi:predicted TIM-barrel enzyme
VTAAPPEYVYPPPDAGTVPDSSSTDERWVAEVCRQVAAQLAAPTGGRVLVAEVGVDVGGLIDNEAAKSALANAADALTVGVIGE